MKTSKKELKKQIHVGTSVSFWRLTLTVLILLIGQRSTAQRNSHNDTSISTIVDDTVYEKHLEILNKLNLAQSIQRKYNAAYRLIFYFRNKQSNSKEAAALIVVDKNNIPVEGFQFPSCCDSTVFKKRVRIKKKNWLKLSKVNFSPSESSNNFCEYRRFDVMDLFEVVFSMKNGNLESGVLIGGDAKIASGVCSNNYLISIRNILLGR